MADQRLRPELSVSARASITVRLRPQWVWHRLCNPCNWPQYLKHLNGVTQNSFDIDEYTWAVSGSTCRVRLTVREPPLHLAWQSQPANDSDANAIQLSGEIILEPRDWVTHLTVRLNYVTRDPRLHAVLQPLESELQRDLKRIAGILERPVLERPA